MTTTTATASTRRAGGRPRDPELAGRFIEAGIRCIAERGLHRFSVDVVAADIRAGKAGFYRRWDSVDHFLADVIRRLAVQPADGVTATSLMEATGSRVRDLLDAPAGSSR
jgi:AcrR family transcriptional regulator